MFDLLLDVTAQAEPAGSGQSPWPVELDHDAPDDTDDGAYSVARCLPSGWLALEMDTGTADPEHLSDADLIDSVVAWDRLTSWAEARQARLLAEFARRRPGDDPRAIMAENPSMISRYAPDEIGMALRLSRGTAMVRLARSATLAGPLAATLRAWEQGHLDAAKVRALCDAAAVLTPEHATAVQDRVLPRAPRQTLAQLRAALARAVIAVDPDGAAERHRRARRDRRVAVGQESDGMASLWALLAAPDALASYEWLTRLARSLGAADPRGMDARRADLMVALLTGKLNARIDDEADETPGGEPGSDGSELAPAGTAAGTTNVAVTRAEPRPADTSLAAPGPTATDHTGTADACSAPAEPDPDGTGRSGSLPGATAGSPSTAAHSAATGPAAVGPLRPPPPAPPGKPLVHVVIPYSTLLGADDQPCELAGYGPIPADLAREIAADAVWKRLVTDPLSGTLLDHGRTTYRPPAALAEFVRARDLHCRSPICGRRALNCELDHTVGWTSDGVTADHNLWAGCPHDHHLKHDAAGWTVTQHRDGRLVWTTPTGHRYASEPHDYRPGNDRTHSDLPDNDRPHDYRSDIDGPLGDLPLGDLPGPRLARPTPTPPTGGVPSDTGGQPARSSPTSGGPRSDTRAQLTDRQVPERPTHDDAPPF